MSAEHPLRTLLREPAFLRIWGVGVFSGIARWLEMLVAGIFAFEVTGSPFLVALLVILRMLPLVVFGSVLGTFADRLSPRRLLLASGVAGAILLLAADIAVQLLSANGEMKLGVVTSLVGAPFFLFLILKSRNVLS